MAEEILKYKVEIDSSDVAEQLQNIRNQVDLAMGSLAAQQVKPTTFEKVSRTFESANIGAVADQFRQKFEKDTSQTLGTMTNMLDRTADRMQLGFSRFTGDLRRIGLLSDPSRDPTTAPLGGVPRTSRMGFGRAIAATLGMGYDPRDPYTSTDYMLAGGARLSRGFETFTRDWGITGIGAALGSIGGLPGAVAGGLIGAGVQAGVDVLTSAAQDVQTFGRGLAQIGGQNIRGMAFDSGRISPFAQGQAEALYDWTRSREGRMMGLSMEELEAQISDYAGAGGFRGMTPSEFSSTLFQLPGAVRLLSQGANMAQGDASALLGDMMRMGFADNVLGASTQALQTANLGAAVGMDPSQIFGAGMAGLNATAGIGMNPGDAFRLSTNIAGIAGQGVLQGLPGMTALSNQLGGPQQAGFALFEQGVREMMSPLGLARTAAIQGGGRQGAGVLESLAGAANFFSADPGNIFSAIANQGNIVGQMSPLTVANAPVQNAVELMQNMGLTNSEGQVNSDQLTGLMMTLDPSLSQVQASAMVEAAEFGPTQILTQQIMSAKESLVDINRVNAVSPFNRMWTNATQPFVDTWDDTIGWAGRGLLSGITNVTQSIGDSIRSFFTGVNIQRRDMVQNELVQDWTTNLVKGGPGSATDIINEIAGSNFVPDNTVEQTTRLDAQDQVRQWVGKLVDAPGFLGDEAAAAIFTTMTYNKSNEARNELSGYLQREFKSGRIDKLYNKDGSINLAAMKDYIADLQAYDAASAEFNTMELDSSAREKATKGYKTIQGIVNSSAGTFDQYKSLWGGMTDMDILNEIAVDIFDIEGGYGALGSGQKVAAYRFLSDFRNLTEDGHGGHAQLTSGFVNLSGPLSREDAMNMEKILEAKALVRGAMGTDEFTEALNSAESAVTDALTDTASGEFMSGIAQALGIDGDPNANEIAKWITGQDSKYKNIDVVIRELEKGDPAQKKLANELRGFQTIGRTHGGNYTHVVGETTMTTEEILQFNKALDLQEDIVNDVNSFMSILPSDLQDDTVRDAIESITIAETLAGKDKETIQTIIEGRTGKIAEYKKRMAIQGISSELKKVIGADVLSDAYDLSEAIDYQSKFAGMDASIQAAADKALAQEFYITGARVNKKLEDAIAVDETGSAKTFIRTGT